MSKDHGISWLNVPGRTGITWNPIVGCSPVSPGCKNCYAAAMAKREAAMGQRQYRGRTTKSGVYNGTTRLVKTMLDRPLTWKRQPRFCFVCSMGDFCHETVPQEWNDAVLRTIADSKAFHRYAFLTKRPERMGEVFGEWKALRDRVILGTSIENQKTADERLRHLRDLAALGWKTMVSYEPALGPVDFEAAQVGETASFAIHDWLVMGGETGPGARECNVEWIRSAAQQAEAAGVPCFVKQLGAWGVYHDFVRIPTESRSGNYYSEWPHDVQVREWPEFLTEGV